MQILHILSKVINFITKCILPFKIHKWIISEYRGRYVPIFTYII